MVMFESLQGGLLHCLFSFKAHFELVTFLFLFGAKHGLCNNMVGSFQVRFLLLSFIFTFIFKKIPRH